MCLSPLNSTGGRPGMSNLLFLSSIQLHTPHEKFQNIYLEVINSHVLFLVKNTKVVSTCTFSLKK